jgi:hypothetical protein
MRRALLLVLFVALALAAGGLVSAGAASKRVALVIGNANYQYVPHLANPKNDATDMAAALERLGFTIVLGVDLDKAAMDQTVRRFAQAATGAEVGVLFYAGHGIQVSGQNYLVPIDAKLEDGSGIDFELVRVDLVQRTMEREASTNLLFLDACRANPLARNLARAMGTRTVVIGQGLAPIESGVGTLISFSTQPGNVAVDGTGRNSPYSGALVQQLNRADEDVSDLLINVRKEVMSATNNLQVPWEHSALTERFYFSPSSGVTKPADTAVPSSSPSYEQQAELAFWATVKDSRNPNLLQSYLDRFPKGIFAGAARVLIDQAKQERAVASLTVKGEEANKADEARSSLGQPRTDGKADRERLVRDLQTELTRVGCEAGSPDGAWGDKAKSALAEFAKRSQVALATNDPTDAALNAVRGWKGRICPLVCADDKVERDGHCVSKPRARKPEASATHRPSRSASGAREREPAKSGARGSGTCWSNERTGGPQFVPCSDPRSSDRKAF